MPAGRIRKHTSGSGQYHIIGAAQGGHKHNKRDQPQPCHIEAEGSEKYMGCHAVIPEIHIIGIGDPERDPVTHSPEKKGGKGFGQDQFSTGSCLFVRIMIRVPF